MQVIECARVRSCLRLYRAAPWYLLWPWKRRVASAVAHAELFDVPPTEMFGCAFARPI